MSVIEDLDTIRAMRAEQGYATALASNVTPDKAAEDARIAKEFNLPPEMADAITPEQRAAYESRKQKWVDNQLSQPVFQRRMGELSFANVVKDDIANVGMFESLAWKIAGEPGRDGGIRNSIARGLYGSVNTTPGGNVDALIRRRKELDNIKRLEQGIAEGKSDAELFGTEQDPTGVVERARFDLAKEARKRKLTREIGEFAESTRWASEMQALFPVSENTRKVFEAKGFSDTAGAVLDHPVDFLADIGPESLVQFAPAAAGLMLTGATGAPIGVSALGVGAFSYGQDRAASLMERMQKAGVDTTNEAAITNYFLNSPEFAGDLAAAEKHAMAVGSFDALSMRLSRFMLPAKLKPGNRMASSYSRLMATPYTRVAANFATQAGIQSTLGAAGEATGQLMADREITSWADVVAEAAGEHFTGPIEVATAAWGAHREAVNRMERTKKVQAFVRDLNAMAQGSKALERAPELVGEFVEEVSKNLKGADTIYVSATELNQAGLLDRLKAVSPTVAAKAEEALATGSDIGIPTREYLENVARSDVAEEIVPHVHVAGEPTELEAAEAIDSVAREASRQAVAKSKLPEGFQDSARAVGKAIGELFASIPDIPTAERQGLRAIAQSLVTNFARDLGLDPMDVWDQYGVQALFGANDVQVDEQGRVVAVSERAKQFIRDKYDALNQAAKRAKPVSLGPVYEGYAGKPAEALAKLRKEKTGCVLDAFNWRGQRIGIAYGVRGRGKQYRHGFGLSHIDAKHPGVADHLQEILDKAELVESEKPNRVYLWDHQHNVVLDLEKRDGQPEGPWIVTAYFDEIGWQNDFKKDKATGGHAHGPDVASASRILTSRPNPVETNFAPKKSRSYDLDQNVRGKFLLEPRVILRLKNADASTVLHELGHAFLNMRIELAAQLAGRTDLTPSQQRWLEATEELVEWLGASSIEDFRTATGERLTLMHEKFAKGFEAYLYEGRAPTSKLALVFRAFAAWLKHVYGALSSAVGIELDDSARVMFDKFFTSSVQAREAQLRRSLFSILDQMPKPAVPVDGDGAVELPGDADAFAEAEEKLRAAGIRDTAFARNLHARVSRQLRDKAKKLWKEARDRIYDELMKSPQNSMYVAVAEGLKIPVADLVDAGVDKATIDTLAEKGLTMKIRAKGHVPGAETASAFGFPTLGEFAKALATMDDPREFADDMATQTMLEEHGELYDEDAIKAYADEAVFNETLGKMLATQVNYLLNLSDNGRISSAMYLEIARASVAAMGVDELARTVKEARSRAETKGREALKLVAKDRVKAAYAMRAQLYQVQLARAAQESLTRLTKATDKIREVSAKKTISGMQTQFLEQAQWWAAKLGFTKFRFVNAVPPWDAFVEEQKTLHGIDVPPMPVDVQEMLSRGLAIENMTVEQAEACADFIMSLLQMGRNAQRIIVNGRNISVAEATEKLAKQIEDNADARGMKLKDNTSRDGATAKALDAFTGFIAAHDRFFSLLTRMAGGREGPMFDYIVKPLMQAADKEEQMRADVAERLDRAFAPLAKTAKNHKKIYFANLDWSGSLSQLLSIALNLGNNENRDRIIGGSTEMSGRRGKPAWTLEAILLTISEHFDAEQISALQDVWDVVGSLWPEVAALERRVGGREPVKVEPVPITFISKDGQKIELRGGYYPITYDSKQSPVSQQQADETDALTLLAGARGQVNTKTGREKTRVKTLAQGRPLLLSPSVAFTALNDVIHDVCWREALAQFNRLIAARGPVARAISDRWGAQTLKSLRNWSEEVANNGKDKNQTLQELANWLRAGVSLAGIGFNLVTAAIQPLGYVQTVAVLGGRYATGSMLEFISSPRKIRRIVEGKSTMMQGRSRTRFRELAEVSAKLTGNTSSWRETVTTFAYAPIAVCQAFVDIPTWWGAYHRALDEGRTEEDAIVYADRIVMDAQGSGRLSELSALERGGAWQKLFTVFYTFFNTSWNILRNSAATESRLRFAYTLFLIVIVQSVMDAVLRFGLEQASGGGDDDDWEKKLASRAMLAPFNFGLNLLVGVRELADITDLLLGEQAPQYGGPSGLRVIGDTYRFATQAAQGEVDEAFVKSLGRLIGDVARLPTTPVTRAVGGANALMDGKTENPLVLLLGYHGD